jgi:hypothetical protein
MGVRVLAVLKALFLRVAVIAEGVDPTLSASNVESLFALSGSHVAAKRLYDGGLSLPSKLPHRRAKELLGAFYEAVVAVRLTEVGLVVSNLLLDVSAQADTAGLAAPIDAVVAAIEPLMKAKLTITDTSGGGSSSSSSPPVLSPLPLPTPIGPPPPQASPLESLYPLPPPPFALAPHATLGENLRALLEPNLVRRRLTEAEWTIVATAAADALQALGPTPQRAPLATEMLQAISAPSTALLWATALELARTAATEPPPTPNELAEMLRRVAGEVAATLFASALGF